MKKIAALLLCIVLLSGCQQNNEKKDDSLPKQPEEIQALSNDLLILMGKIDLIPSTNMAISEKKKNDLIAQNKEKEISDLSNDRLSEEDRKKHEEEKIKVSISSFTLENSIIYELLKKENIKRVNDLDKKDLPFTIEQAWLDIKRDVVDIHGSWNEVKAKLDSVSIEDSIIENFENNLASLTKSVDEMKVLDSLVYINNLTKYIADFNIHYKSLVNPHIERMKYSIRKAVLLSHLGRFDEALQTLENVSDDLNKVSQAIQKEDKDAFLKIKYSIEDLKKAVQSQDLKMINIKAPIVIDNLNQVKTIKD
ncbi:hypothetical protein SAMN05661008_00782 [Alkalithermobacter thermoalcaliphilus JW-YL-7 = DSM 7308]|uniref:Lipoprotein n=1 Tax=Alkalithermobacter thermoalcaliphilus JW-YL-7 = DSM 7308 TaxID=1121328 RepID=A0A150FU14_CLOPD|nr:hypothetical protein JWYL7_1595 [[Clostridium] paradoxum JW-YL-7 = DSM 7308]SHK72135.1 hypothetical protein SAMN05661008_00782 [[Clostridium] paradoxum JW-YL-7 = DSM 7308]